MADADAAFRAQIIAVARGFDGVAYRHQGADRHGCDCLGLVRAVWRELYGTDAEIPPAYGPGWADASGVETLLNAAERHLQPRPVADMAAGDVLVFRWRPGLAAKHCGILTAEDRMIHAYESVGRVAEGHLAAAWRRRIAGCFSFPVSLTDRTAADAAGPPRGRAEMRDARSGLRPAADERQAAEGRGSDRCPPGFPGVPAQGQPRSGDTARERNPERSEG